MKRYFRLLAFVVAALFASCNNEKIVPDTPTEGELVQLTFGSTDVPGTRAVWKDETGKGNLVFNWESDTRMAAVISNGSEFISNYSAPDNYNDSQYHTLLTVTPQENPHYATFKTERYYSENEINTQAKKIFVTSGYDNNITSNASSFRTSMEMPNLFTQQASQQSDFLREYMMLYGEAEMKDGSAQIPFNHIPATFRFIITNQRPAATTTIKSVQVTLVDAEGNVQSVAADHVAVVIEL